MLTDYFISIHSPRMGRDPARRRAFCFTRDFNPLSPHGERPVLVVLQKPLKIFQSTLPAWGETASDVQ